jgi:hypothetical protein
MSIQATWPEVLDFIGNSRVVQPLSGWFSTGSSLFPIRHGASADDTIHAYTLFKLLAGRVPHRAERPGRSAPYGFVNEIAIRATGEKQRKLLPVRARCWFIMITLGCLHIWRRRNE